MNLKHIGDKKELNPAQLKDLLEQQVRQTIETTGVKATVTINEKDGVFTITAKTTPKVTDSKIKDARSSDLVDEEGLHLLTTAVEKYLQSNYSQSGGADRPGDNDYYGKGEDQFNELVSDEGWDEDEMEQLPDFDKSGYWYVRKDWNDTGDFEDGQSFATARDLIDYLNTHGRFYGSIINKCLEEGMKPEYVIMETISAEFPFDDRMTNFMIKHDIANPFGYEWDDEDRANAESESEEE